MKPVILLLMLVVGVSHTGFSQSAKLGPSGDSLRIESERAVISTELIQLRDSIEISLITFNTQISKARPAKAEKLEAARNELTEYKDRLELDLEEIATTARNSWSDYAMQRIRLAASATRRECKRICTILY